MAADRKASSNWFTKWYEAQKDPESAYVLRIARAHARYPNAALSQLRGHALEKQKRLSDFQERVRRVSVPEFFTLREKVQYEKILSVLRSMKKGEKSLTKAAQDEKIGRETVLRHLRNALTKTPKGWQPKKSDDLIRDLNFPNKEGHVVVKGLPVASSIGHYWNAIDRYVVKGDSTALKPFEGRTFKDVFGKRHTFVTDAKTLNRLARAGELRFEDLYRH